MHKNVSSILGLKQRAGALNMYLSDRVKYTDSGPVNTWIIMDLDGKDIFEGGFYGAKDFIESMEKGDTHVRRSNTI